MIKIDIISGFLGAGKTTLIMKMLTSFLSKDEKLVIIENEFGKIGIDGELIRREGFEVYELTNGCICCTLKSDFQFTLKEIVDKVKPDRIIFEPSGIFILSDVLEILHLREFSSKCIINSVVTVIDAVHFLKQNARYGDFFNNQIKNASTLILSKTQLINEDEIKLIVAKLREINHTAEILTKYWDDLTASDIMDLPTQVLNSQINEQNECQCHECKSSFRHNNKESHGFETFGARVPAGFKIEEIEHILKSLSSQDFGIILRAKGFLNSEDAILEFNFVDGQYSIEKKDGVSSGMVSVIGINLNRVGLSELFHIT
jgi:G3E family GTPase